MTTHFTGVKLAKNPIPIVKNPFLISGYPEGSSLATNQAANDSSITNLAFNAGDLTGGDLNQGLITLLV
jgi:hypothetical protein